MHHAERDEKVAAQLKMMLATMVNVVKQELSRLEDEADTCSLSASEPVGSRSRSSVHGGKSTRGSKKEESKESAAREGSIGALAENELPSSELQSRKLFSIYDQFYLDRTLKVQKDVSEHMEPLLGGQQAGFEARDPRQPTISIPLRCRLE